MEILRSYAKVLKCSLNSRQALAPAATPISVTKGNFGRIPRVYIETLRDRAITPAAQKEMYERTPCQRVISMDTSHLPLYSAPEELAGHLSSLSAPVAPGLRLEEREEEPTGR